MYRKNTLKLPAKLNQALDGLPLAKSVAVAQAILSAEREPESLARAFQLRLHQPTEENDITISYVRTPKIEEPLRRLTEMTRLPGEQVVRLCLEAYIHRL